MEAKKRGLGKGLGRGLGRGLETLLSEVGQSVLEQPSVETLKHIEVSRIRAGVYQPRKHFDAQALQELALSIAEHGLLQPLVVRPVEDERYEIIAGERRFRAGQQAGLSKMPCLVRQYSDREALAVALIENLQRSDLNVLEVAQGLQQLVKDFTLTHEQAAQLIGRSRSSVSNTLRLLELSEPVKTALAENEIEMGHARAMLSLGAVEQQMLLNEVVGKRLTVRQTEAKVRDWKEAEQPVKKPTKLEKKSHDIKSLEGRISDALGASTTIAHQAKGSGKIVMKYKNLDELDALLARLGVVTQ